MTEGVLISDCKVLKPNKEHRNFTETNEILNKGLYVTGDFVNIEGLRRGEPFTYRLFITSDKKIIYQNCVEQMRVTDVKLGADAGQTPTVVDLKGNETFSRNKTMGLAAGAIAGFAYSRYKKHDWKKIATMTLVGGAVGYFAVRLFEKNKSITFTPSR